MSSFIEAHLKAQEDKSDVDQEEAKDVSRDDIIRRHAAGGPCIVGDLPGLAYLGRAQKGPLG